ncbi:MAG: glycoside hydrolase family 127 protein [Planctomycetia bacterium]|nr:glycoside hydrolase family 127 protein [Planctomycetia bacterium]
MSVVSAVAGVWPSGREKVSLEALPFDLRDVRLLDGPFRENLERDRKYLHDLEADRLLYYFRETAGLAAPGEPMGGWEQSEVRGHTMGHFLSAMAMMVAATSDDALKAKADRIVAELARCQKAHTDGYLSAFPKSHIDRVIAREPVWAPWYVLHKILAGLIDVHVYCDNPQALEVAQGLSGWMEKRLAAVDRDAMQRMLDVTEQGGMNEALANLYGLTGDRRWWNLSLRFVEDHYVQPLSRGEDRLKGEHANSFIPNIVGTARQFELGGDTRDRRIAEFFWSQVVATRCYSTGGTSLDEHWKSDPGKLADQLGDFTEETCCTYNLLKLTHHLLAWQPDRKYADYYERALINGILATQDPKTGMMEYFVTLAPGRWKYFHTPRTSFWCCTGTGMENHARYGEAIYAHNADSLWVNLFIASELTWKEKGVRIRQETQFPNQEHSSLLVKATKPTAFVLRVRVPEWTDGKMTVRLNGQPLETAADATGYLAIGRTWSDGDRVEIDLPMHVWAWPMPDDPTLLTVMYGPLVLAGKLGGEGLTTDIVYTDKNWFPFPEDKTARAPDIVTDHPDPAVWVQPVTDQPLTFRTVGVGRPHDVTLVPYHRLWDERYAIYWRVLPEPEWQKREAERRAREAVQAARREMLRKRTVDEVRIADETSERTHDLQGEKTATGTHLKRSWRHAPDGWFSYRLKVLPDQPMVLFSTYWGSDVGARTFDIFVDGTKIATQTLANNRPQEFFDVEYPIPENLTSGRQQVTIRFQAQSGNIAGGVFERVSILKAAP